MTNSDSIRSKLFEEGGGRFGGGGRNFLEKVSPPPPNIHNLNNDTDPT